jgi:NADH:ubiquinone oxidoreductase subunit 6 (subunit J)
MIYFTLSLLLIFALLAIFLKDNLLSVLSLAAVSALLAIVFFQLQAPVAGVFELSVGAGLITVLAILTISFIQSKHEKAQPGALLWALIALAAASILFFFFQLFNPGTLSPTPAEAGWNEVGLVLWKARAFDLFPQVLIVLAAILGILALLRKKESVPVPIADVPIEAIPIADGKAGEEPNCGIAVPENTEEPHWGAAVPGGGGK